MIEEITTLVKLMRALSLDEVRDFLKQNPGLINQDYNVYQLGTYLTIESHPAGGWTPLGYAAAVLRNIDLVNVLLEFNPDLTQEIHPFDGTDGVPPGIPVGNFVLELQLEENDRMIGQTIASLSSSTVASATLNSNNSTMESLYSISDYAPLADLLGRMLTDEYEKDPTA